MAETPTPKRVDALAPLRVMIVDDDPGDRALAARELRREFPGVKITEASNREELRAAVEKAEFDLVITDYHLGWSDGIAVLATVRARKPGCPVIMFTGTGSEEIAVHAMKAGLDDYVLKSPKHFGRLPGTIHAVMERAAARQAAREAETRYRELFERVPIGLYRRGFDGTILEANPALVRILGHPDRSSLVGRNVAEMLVEVDVRAVSDETGRVKHLDGAMEDISARKLAEQQLQESLGQLRQLFD